MIIYGVYCIIISGKSTGRCLIYAVYIISFYSFKGNFFFVRSESFRTSDKERGFYLSMPFFKINPSGKKISAGQTSENRCNAQENER